MKKTGQTLHSRRHPNHQKQRTVLVSESEKPRSFRDIAIAVVPLLSFNDIRAIKIVAIDNGSCVIRFIASNGYTGVALRSIDRDGAGVVEKLSISQIMLSKGLVVKV
jgi:hypothetical protein